MGKRSQRKPKEDKGEKGRIETENQGKTGFFNNIRLLFGRFFGKKSPMTAEEEPTDNVDKNPSVGTENFLSDAIEPEEIPSTNLPPANEEANNKAYEKWKRRRERRDRQKAEREAAEKAEEINKPAEPIFEELLEEHWDDNAAQAAISQKKKSVQVRAPKKPRRLTAKQKLKQVESQDDIPTIDLHGLFKDQAIARVKELINGNQQESLVCIITGKGTRSENGRPVLRPLVRGLLEEYKRIGKIKAFKSAPPKLGGEGAFVVEIR